MRRPRRSLALCALPLLVAGGCTKKEEPKTETAGEETKADAPKGAETPAEDGTKDAPKAPPSGVGALTAAKIQAATAAAASVPVLKHEGVLGHFMVGDAVAFTKEIREQATPPKVGHFVDLEAMKSLAAMQLGDRGTVAVRVDLAKPFGCALVDHTSSEVPVACTVAYKGGAEALVTDLGEKDKQTDAKGHLAAYSLEGETIFIDKLGEHVVLTNHEDLYAKSKDYLQSNIIDRADEAIADFEVVVYPSAAMARYSDDVESFVSLMDAAQEGMPGSGGGSDLKKRISEMEQFSGGLGLTPLGAHVSFISHAKPGSDLQTESDVTYGGRMDEAFVSKLPASTFMFLGAQTGQDITKSEYWEKGIKQSAELIAKDVDFDAATLEAEFRAFGTEQAELYGRDIAMALFNEGPLGAAVIEVSKKAPGRDKWKTWSERFKADQVLPAKTQKKLAWTFEPGAATVEGVEVDRWLIQPTAEGLKDFEGKDLEPLRKLWPDLAMRVDRVELDDRVLFVLGPNTGEDATKAAILASRGGPTVRDHKGWSNLDMSRDSLAALWAADVAGGVEWLRKVLPPSKFADIPSPLGVGLDDVTLVTRHPAPGVVSVSLNVSQAFIDQLKMLANE
jgi:hypothetical protein